MVPGALYVMTSGTILMPPWSALSLAILDQVCATEA